jgi:predicted DNA-binding protein YlxM (UPF0122 family)
VLRNEAERQVRQALTTLPEKHRIVLVLHYYDRMHYSQIANALNMSLSAVRVRIFRAKRFLRRKLGRTHRSDLLARLDPQRKLQHKEEQKDALASGSGVHRLLPASPPSMLPVCFAPRAN